jgi:hypothetical protein
MTDDDPVKDVGMTEEERQKVRTAFHESAHALVSYILRQPIRYVSIRRGETFLGVMVHGRSAPLDDAATRLVGLPGIVQPFKLRRRVEGDICVSLAGDIGERLVWLGSGYIEDSVDEPRAATIALEFAGLSRADAGDLAARERDPTPHTLDEENATNKAYALAGEEGWALLSYLRPVTKRLLWDYRDDVAALAEELLKHDVIPGRKVRELLREQGVRQW